MSEQGKWVPMRHDDPHNDGPVWLDENGRVCWAGSNGETHCLILHGDMAICRFVADDDMRPEDHAVLRADFERSIYEDIDRELP